MTPARDLYMPSCADSDIENDTQPLLLAHRVLDAKDLCTNMRSRPSGHFHQQREVSRLAYELGWDMAHYGVRCHDRWPGIYDMVVQGWSDGTQHFGTRTRPHDAFIKKWLKLRGSALSRGKICHESVTATHLKYIAPRFCPIVRTLLCYDGTPLDKETQSDRIWSVDRLNNDGAYIAGNIVVMSEAANKAKDSFGFEELQVMQNYLRDLQVQAEGGLNRIEWARLTALASMIACNDDNWKTIAMLPVVIAPPPEVLLHGAVWPMILDFMTLPWSKGGGVNMGRMWMKRFKGKQLQRAAHDAADCFYRACFRLQSNTQFPTKWIAEDAWTNPAFQQVWSKFIGKLDLDDVKGSVAKPESAIDVVQWRKAAGLTGI